MTTGGPAHGGTAARRRADLELLTVTAVWGATFVMVKDALADIGPLTFVAFRFAIAALALLPLLLARGGADLGPRHGTPGLARLIQAGGIVGVLLFAGYAFQTAGLQYSGAGRAGFITGLSVVLVPLASALILRQPLGRAVAAGVALATAGLGLLSLGDLASQPLALGLGDLLVFGCAWSFALHILALGRFAPEYPPLGLAFAQITAVALLSGVAALIWETSTSASLLRVWPAAAFTGVLATVVGYTAQTRAQRWTTPTHTALIFSTEPVWAAAFAYIFAGEWLGPSELLGCAMILAGMLLVQLSSEP